MLQTAEHTEVGAAPAAAPAVAGATPAPTAAGADATSPTAAMAVAQAPATTVIPVSPAPRTLATSTQVPARPAPVEPASAAGSLAGTVFALVLVVGLILALGWLLKRMPGFQRGAGGNGLRVLASLPVGPRERIVVVDVAGTQLLLGVGSAGVRTLHTLQTPLPVTDTAQSPQFAQLLAQHFGKRA